LLNKFENIISSLNQNLSISFIQLLKKLKEKGNIISQEVENVVASIDRLDFCENENDCYNDLA